MKKKRKKEGKEREREREERGTRRYRCCRHGLPVGGWDLSWFFLPYLSCGSKCGCGGEFLPLVAFEFVR